MKAILYKDDVKQRQGDYPDLEMKVIALPNGYEWKLLVYDEKPQYNSYLEVLKPTETATDDPHSEHAHLKVTRVSYTVERKSDDEILDLIKETEENANKEILKSESTQKLFILGLAILIRVKDGKNISPRMEQILSKISEKAVNIFQNDVKVKEKKIQVENQEDFNLNDFINE